MCREAALTRQRMIRVCQSLTIVALLSGACRGRPSAVSPQATPDLPGTVAAQVRGTVERVGAQNAALSTSTLVAAPPTAVSPAATETPVPAQATATPVPSVATRTLSGWWGALGVTAVKDLSDQRLKPSDFEKSGFKWVQAELLIRNPTQAWQGFVAPGWKREDGTTWVSTDGVGQQYTWIGEFDGGDNDPAMVPPGATIRMQLVGRVATSQNLSRIDVAIRSGNKTAGIVTVEPSSEDSPASLVVAGTSLPSAASSGSIKCGGEFELTHQFDGHRSNDGRDWAIQSVRIKNVSTRDIAIRPFKDFVESYGADGAYARTMPSPEPLHPAEDRLALGSGQVLNYQALVPLSFRGGATSVFPQMVRVRLADTNKRCDQPQDFVRIDGAAA